MIRRVARWIRTLVVAAAAAGGAVAPAFAQTGTVMPMPKFIGTDDSNNPISGGKLCSFQAGTTTALSTYSDVALTVANANPVILDAAGRATVYLTPGLSYKFILKTAGTDSTCNTGTTVWTQDNVLGVPAASSNVDIAGLAGEALTAGQAVYLSAGDGGKTAGQWYKADASNSYSSSTAVAVGIAPSAITSGASGTVRLAGQVTGLSALTLGSTYYISSTPGALTATAPANRRVLGVANSSTSLVLKDVGVPTQPWVNDFRLTLSTGVPVTTSDVTGASAVTLYESPYIGNRIDLPDSSCNPQRVTTAEFSIAVPATTATMYDVFAYLSGSTATLELLAWTNDTTRATAIARTNGRYFKSGDCTRLYVGSFRTGAVSGQTEDSLAKRLVWNYYNRVRRALQVSDLTTTWPYTTAGYRQANGSTANQVAAVIGVPEGSIDLRVVASATNSGAAPGVVVYVGIGLDGIGTFTPNEKTTPANAYTGAYGSPSAQAVFIPTAGYHFYTWMEYSVAAGTTTWNGTTASPFSVSGLYGSFEG
jgi:hypothetical protein